MSFASVAASRHPHFLLCLLLSSLLGCSDSETVVQSQNSPPAKATMDRLTGAPEDGSTGQSLTPVLSWQCSDADGDPLRYDVYLGTSPAPPLWASGRFTTCIVSSPLEYSTVYYWRIVATDSHGGSTPSDTWSFRTRNPDLICDASGTPLRGWPPLTVNFTGVASEGLPPYHFLWVFGDDSTSRAQNPTHTFTRAGTFTTVLKVTDAEEVTCSKTLKIIVDGPPICIAYADPSVGPPPLTVAFHGDASDGQPPYGFHWVFGDGTESTEPDPKHTYTVQGEYNVVFTVTDSEARSCSTTIPITVGPPLTCTGTASPTSGTVPLTVQFSAAAAGGRSPYRYHWAFGDGSSSGAQYPSHTYHRGGYYTAALTVTDAASRTCSQTLRIIVTSGN